MSDSSRHAEDGRTHVIYKRALLDDVPRLTPRSLLRGGPTLLGHAVMLLGLQVLGAQQPATLPSLRERTCDAVVAGDDSDADGLPDACELALARGWAPRLLADPADCAWTGDRGERRLTGAYLFAVEPLSTSRGAVRIAYLPAYFRDCGWRGIQRVLRLGRTNAHAGDSELIVVDVARNPDASWRPSAVFVSAHCGGRSGGRCRWFRGSELAEFRWTGRATQLGPEIWVARDKHANYPSRKACESGHWRQERCASRAVGYRFPIRSHGQNIGSRRVPAFGGTGCIDGGTLPLPATGALPGSTECFWKRQWPFAGWQGAGKGSADAYSAVLERFGRM